MRNPQKYYDLIERPIVTEKTTTLQSIRNQYAFRVANGANKPEVKKAIETLFNVHVEKVAMITVPGKMRRILGRPAQTKPWKKAIVTLKKGESIDMT
jgi:large subunit ribosomal protein L23